MIQCQFRAISPILRPPSIRILCLSTSSYVATTKLESLCFQLLGPLWLHNWLGYIRHPALIRDHALRPRKAPRAPSRRVWRGPPRASGEHTSPRPRPARRGAATGKAARPFPTAPLFPLSRPTGPRLPSLPHAAPSRTLRTLNGGTRLSPLSTAPSSFLRHSQTKAPSLRRRYPASPHMCCSRLCAVGAVSPCEIRVGPRSYST